MMNKERNIYVVSPSSVRFDQEMVEFNRVPDGTEYEATKLSISLVGQQDPIAINDQSGLCEDGRTRCRACTELGIEVKCVEIDGSIPKVERLAMYNINAMSGRDLTPAQKAIQAHKYAKLTNDSIDLCAKRFKSTTRNVSDANTIAGLGRTDILDAITAKGEWTRPTGGKPVKSLRTIASELRAEQEVLKETIDNQVKIDYSELINTQRGKTQYWQLRTILQIDPSTIDRLLVELMNYRYVLDVDADTGEVINDT